MNTRIKVLTVALVLILAAIPAYAVVETAGGGELSLTDFQKMYAGQKSIVAQSEYDRYQYRLKHPAPKVTLEASRMRSEATLADFQKVYAGQKPIVARSEYEWGQYRLKHPVQVAFGKPEGSEHILKPWLKRG